MRFLTLGSNSSLAASLGIKDPIELMKALREKKNIFVLFNIKYTVKG